MFFGKNKKTKKNPKNHQCLKALKCLYSLANNTIWNYILSKIYLFFICHVINVFNPSFVVYPSIIANLKKDLLIMHLSVFPRFWFSIVLKHLNCLTCNSRLHLFWLLLPGKRPFHSPRTRCPGLQGRSPDGGYWLRGDDRHDGKTEQGQKKFKNGENDKAFPS